MEGMKRIMPSILFLMPCVLLSGTLSITMENDFPFHDDSDYTHGTRIAYRTESGLSFGVQQQMYTPYDIRDADPVPGRHAYAGTLVGVLGDRIERKRDGWILHDDLELQLGVLGPSSHAGETQKLIHKWLDCKYPAGWEHQLHDEAIVQLVWWRGADVELARWSGDWSVRLDAEAGGMLGTLQTAPGVNATLLVGRHVPSGRVQELSVRSPGRAIDRMPELRVYGLLGASGRWWLRNELLDGNAGYVHGGVSTTTEKKALTGCLKAGFGVGLGKFDARIVYMWWTKEFDTQETEPNYASIEVSWRF